MRSISIAACLAFIPSLVSADLPRAAQCSPVDMLGMLVESASWTYDDASGAAAGTITVRGEEFPATTVWQRPHDVGFKVNLRFEMPQFGTYEVVVFQLDAEPRIAVLGYESHESDRFVSFTTGFAEATCEFG
ncbi:hypothetical protein JJJ17_14195 [Paracoccus caeni]|uniref:Uncharacterized protein n=1 Tax=Paracoccus caeni TaxID=657651 RepID=A0A934W1S1_9RHOB|nr:hypothetical protein [Paracoccus caeni]MBK4217079.1 hypothetical protein [Paracoccus caeni]